MNEAKRGPRPGEPAPDPAQTDLEYLKWMRSAARADMATATGVELEHLEWIEFYTTNEIKTIIKTGNTMKAEQIIRRKLYRAHRRAIGTQSRVADKLGLSRATIQRKENGDTPITLADLYALYYLSPLDKTTEIQKALAEVQ